MSLTRATLLPAPAVSVVIPTYCRVELLQRCLDALVAQDLDPELYEIVVVDDGHEDSVATHIAARAARTGNSPWLRYLRPAQGRGPAVARNCGWRAARGEIVAFTDDDTLPEAAWLREGAATLQRHAEWSGLCGRIRVPLAHGGRPTDHERMTIGLESAEFATANAFVRRAALERVHGFDERFSRAWREDSDLQFRLMQEVAPIGREPRAVVLHPARAERWGVCLRQQRNAFFDALLYKKHPRLYRTRIRPVPPWNYYVMVGLAVAAPLLLWSGSAAAAATAALLLVGFWLQLAWARLRHTALALPHVVEMLATSALIPFLSVYWRLRGAIRFRVLFL
jgi:glycosyltransferase involved in cell wall biosynthesis